MYKEGLIRNIRFISKFMTSQPADRTIAIHILPNISRSKANQTMKFCQLIEYNTAYRKNGTQNPERTQDPIRAQDPLKNQDPMMTQDPRRT